MILLGIETSTRAGSVALLRDGDVLGERLLPETGRRHAQTLIVEIRDLLLLHRLQPADLDGVAVSIGPGSFTGLRVGAVCAKTLAYAVGCRVAAVDTLLAIAENSLDGIQRVDVVANAQRNELFVGRYRRSSDGFVREGAVSIVGIAEFCGRVSAGDVVSGPASQLIESQLPLDCTVLPEACRTPRAVTVALLGRRKLLTGRDDDFWTLEPFYLRKSAAEEKWEAKET